MRIIKNTLFAFAVSMTALFNFASAQNDVQITYDSEGNEQIVVTYEADKPNDSIGMTIMGDTQITIRRFARVSNEAIDIGMCIATYNVQDLKNSGSGETFQKAYNSVKSIAVYRNCMQSDEKFLFEDDKLEINLKEGANKRKWGRKIKPYVDYDEDWCKTSECIVLISDGFETVCEVRPILCKYLNLCA